MAEETDLKKIELKVTVNCCDGCKRKVKKLLRTVEGVLKTEIDPVNPKVSILGSVDPVVLIKKLGKAGKQAELLSCTSLGENEQKKENKETEKPGREKNPNPEQTEKHPDPTSPEKIIKEAKPVEAGEIDPKKNLETVNPAKSLPGEAAVKGERFRPPAIPEVKYTVYPNVFLETASVRNVEQHPYPVGMPYYTVCSYFTPLPHQPAFGPDFVPYGGVGPGAAARPAFEAPVTRVGDYFSEENTVGCSVM